VDDMTVTVVGLAAIKDNKLLLARKKGSLYYILPGGKPMPVEDHTTTLCREIQEETGSQLYITSITYLCVFSDFIDETSIPVKVYLYMARLISEPTPQAEIEELRWVSFEESLSLRVASSMHRQIFPWLVENNYLK
jgi:8-oxo-dGTP diphosphatase